MPELETNDISAAFSMLTPAQQAEVWRLIRNFKPAPSREERRKGLLELAGSISKDDIEIMKRVIEEDCGRIGTS